MKGGVSDRLMYFLSRHSPDTRMNTDVVLTQLVPPEDTVP
jgi:hypothetical protein